MEKCVISRIVDLKSVKIFSLQYFETESMCKIVPNSSSDYSELNSIRNRAVEEESCFLYLSLH